MEKQPIEYKNETHVRQCWDQIQLGQLELISYIYQHGLSLDFIRQFQDKFDNDKVFWESVFWFNIFNQKELEEFKDKEHWEQYFSSRDGYESVSEEFRQKWRQRLKEKS